MGKLIVVEFMTLDGVAQSGGGPDEDRDGGFSHGGWHAPYLDPEAGRVMLEGAKTMDALLLGRRTYNVLIAGPTPASATGTWRTAPADPAPHDGRESIVFRADPLGKPNRVPPAGFEPALPPPEAGSPPPLWRLW
jgi:dihydrofolate reductase